MASCPMCFTEVPEDSPAIVAGKITEARLDWNDFGPGRWKSYHVGDKFTILGVGTAEVASVKLYDGPPGWSDGELPQGTEFDAHVVLKVGEHYYRVTGRGDSYNDVTWSNIVLPVKATPKTVTVYEFA